MSDVIIDIYEYLVDVGRLDANMSMDKVMDYIEKLPESDQQYLLSKVLYLNGYTNEEGSECKSE